ncbi:uncharacterized protein LOC135483081 [Lineus longissimus]|uniref:uncharacterized protein LOC135483081 n=1 Tax=Lineus longissimus TaxID=88925 RepID=UPI00315C86BD
MGGICPCFGKEPEHTYAPVPSSNSEKTPLLASGSYGSTKPRSSATNDAATVASARLKHSADPPNRSFEENDLRPLSVDDVGVPNLDKQFQDHVMLFNDYLDKYNQLKATISEMMSTYDDTGVTPGTLTQIFSMLKGELNEEAQDSLKVVRKFKFCMELKFEAKFVNGYGVAILDGFNKANRLVKDLVDKGPTLVQTVTMVVENEEQSKRDVTVYYSEPERKEQGPEKLKACLKNIGEMKRVKPAVSFIKKEAHLTFDDLQNGAQVLFKAVEV